LVAKSVGFNFDGTSVRTEVAACQTVWQQYIGPLACGAADPSTLPDVIAKFEAAGINKVKAEVQKQLDAWLKSK
jgi:putative aldouronate transport system substrate-binding protein